MSNKLKLTCNSCESNFLLKNKTAHNVVNSKDNDFYVEGLDDVIVVCGECYKYKYLNQHGFKERVK